VIVDQLKLNRWIGLILTICVGEGAWHVLRMLAAFILIHWLTKDQYATFTLILAIKGTAGVLLDLGFTGGLTALIGKRCHEPETVGRYVFAAKFFRDRLIAVGVFGLLIAFYFAAERFDWNSMFALQIWVIVSASIYFESRYAILSPILKLQQRLKEAFYINLSAAISRLVLLVVLYFTGMLTVSAVILASLIETVVSVVGIRRQTTHDFLPPRKSDRLKVEKKEALDLTLPKIPGVVFYALQGQITIFLISTLGSYEEIASLGALNKISLLFMLPTSFIGMLILPWYSKLDHKHLLSGVSMVMMAYCAFGFALVTLNYLFPEVFLILLGDSYGSLKYEIFLYSILAVLNLISFLLYALSASRKWVYYWTGASTIVASLGALVMFAVISDLSQLTTVIYLSIATSIATLLINLAVFIVGYTRSKAAS